MTEETKENTEMEVTKLQKINAALQSRLKFVSNTFTYPYSRISAENPFVSPNGNRDYDTLYGYKDNPSYSDFRDVYERVDIANRVINAPVQALWNKPPHIKSKGTDYRDAGDNSFNTAFNEVAQRVKLFQNIAKADILTGLGRFGILYLGFGGETDKPVRKGAKLHFVRAFGEGNVKIEEFDNDITSERFGEPTFYSITYSDNNVSGSKKTQLSNLSSKRIHWSRIIHITSDSLESKIYGVPRLKPTYNRIIDYIKLVGGAAEMFFLGARPGMAVIADADASFTQDDEAKQLMKEQLDQYEDGFRRTLTAQGVKIQSLSPQVSTPTDHFDMIVSCFCMKHSIPMSILLGSARGNVSSDMDISNWRTYVTERRLNWAEPDILYPFVERLTQFGVLPKSEVEIEWEDLFIVSERDKAEIGQKRATAINLLINSKATNFIPPEYVVDNILYTPADQRDAMLEKIGSAKYEELGSASTAADPNTKSKLQGTTEIGGINPTQGAS